MAMHMQALHIVHTIMHTEHNAIIILALSELPAI